jgi:ABC-type sugar transport system ATPase subunit
MNFVDGRLEHADDAARFVADGLRVPVGRARAALSPQPATLGIRPEALRLAPEPGDDAPSGRVVLVERLGGTSHVHVAVGPHRLVATVAGEPLPDVGDAVALHVPGDAVHLFDAEGLTMR